ncbi:hypothetical protein MTIM_47340 [Mycobacterium timonense]|uniref:RES domain-containing protein n=1 Tax=Mycobacterium timonense TaxID=701043 RepID=A0A7I9ZDC7_9MYCO|nr:hypothetical protein MTIM_47340 [Mycobacterium timonense]
MSVLNFGVIVLKGDSRFAPIDDAVTGKRLPSMYLGETPTTVLLETVFHDVHEEGRIVYQEHLHEKLVAHIHAPAAATLADLRDSQLGKLGLNRGQIVSSPVQHYPCTRGLAIKALAQSHVPPLQGLIWHSRQAELGGKLAQEVIILFCDERYPFEAGHAEAIRPWFAEPLRGPGRLLVDQIADDLRALIETRTS